MSVKKIAFAALFASLIFLSGGQSVLAQVPPSPAAQAYAIHDDLLKCYQNLGKNAETETEFKWLLQNRPGNAVYHFNYACFLQRAGKTGPAAAEYKKAATCDPSNVDFVGSYGQMLLFLKDYNKAYQYLGRAMQMPGGEKYKSGVDTCRTYLQQLAQQRLYNQQVKSGATAGGGKRPKDDDDD